MCHSHSIRIGEHVHADAWRIGAIQCETLLHIGLSMQRRGRAHLSESSDTVLAIGRKLKKQTASAWPWEQLWSYSHTIQPCTSVDGKEGTSKKSRQLFWRFSRLKRSLTTQQNHFSVERAIIITRTEIQTSLRQRQSHHDSDSCEKLHIAFALSWCSKSGDLSVNSLKQNPFLRVVIIKLSSVCLPTSYAFSWLRFLHT